MKKTLLALAVASVVATPLAASAAGHAGGPTWYGSLRVQLVSAGGDLDIGDGSSRWGVKGAHDLGNGLSGIYRFEGKWSGDTAGTNTKGNQSWVGLSGGFGAIVLGRQTTPFYSSTTSAHDPFASGGCNFVACGSKASNALAYALPGGMPIKGAIALVIDGASDEEDDIDAIDAGVSFGAGPVTLGLGYNKAATADDATIAVSAIAKLGGGSIGVLFNDNGTSNPMLITGNYGAFTAQYASADNDADDTAITLGYTHKLGKKAKIQLTVEDNDQKDDTKMVARLRMDF